MIPHIFGSVKGKNGNKSLYLVKRHGIKIAVLKERWKETVSHFGHFHDFFSSPSVIKTIDDDKGKPTLTITARKLENRARPTFQNGPDVEKRPQVRARKHSFRFH